jgi:hypothetical protein
MYFALEKENGGILFFLLVRLRSQIIQLFHLASLVVFGIDNSRLKLAI